MLAIGISVLIIVVLIALFVFYRQTKQQQPSVVFDQVGVRNGVLMRQSTAEPFFVSLVPADPAAENSLSRNVTIRDAGGRFVGPDLALQQAPHEWTLYVHGQMMGREGEYPTQDLSQKTGLIKISGDASLFWMLPDKLDQPITLSSHGAILRAQVRHQTQDTFPLLTTSQLQG